MTTPFTYTRAFLRELARHGRSCDAEEIRRAWSGRIVNEHRGATTDRWTFQMAINDLVSAGEVRKLANGEYAAVAKTGATT